MLRLKRRLDFLRVVRRGKRHVHAAAVLHLVPNQLSVNRVGFSVPGKIGNAVERNRIRRRFSEICRLSSHQLAPGHDFLLVARTGSKSMDYHQMEESLMALFGMAGVVR